LHTTEENWFETNVNRIAGEIACCRVMWRKRKRLPVHDSLIIPATAEAMASDIIVVPSDYAQSPLFSQKVGPDDS
jgi:hypothetical protein